MKLTKIQKIEIFDKYKNGISLLELSLEYNIHKGSINRIIRESGLAIKNKIPVSAEETKYIIEQYQKGQSSEEIAKVLGRVGATICKILRKNNIQIRSKEDRSKRLDLVGEI